MRSRTIGASLAIIICSIAQALGWAVDQGHATEIIIAGLNLIFAAYAIWGRYKARSKIKGIIRRE